jgi:hypothetical protein
MRSLHTLRYPTLKANDRRFIEALRREHDVAFRDVVAPHVTLLFGCDAVADEVYREHVHTICEGQRPIAF